MLRVRLLRIVLPVLLGSVMSAAPVLSGGVAHAQPAGGPGGKKGFNRQIAVRTAAVRLASPQERIQSLGTGKALHEIIVTADVSGTVETVHFEANAPVKKNQPLLTLVRESQKITLSGAKASYARERAALSRYSELAKKSTGFVSQIQLDEARASFAVAEAALASAQYEYDRRVIRAPFAGQVNLTNLTTGSYLGQGDAIVTLADSSSLLVEFSVPENNSAAVSIGVPVRAVTPAAVGRPFFGVVTAFDNSIDAQTRTIRVRASIENPDRALLPGMTFQVQIEPVSQAMPVVPAVAITWNRGGASVWRVGAENQPERVPVLIRRRDGDEVWIEANLKEGDHVVTDGALKVRAGAAIRLVGENAGEQ